MSQTICRMYPSHEQAQGAAQALRTDRFDDFPFVNVVGAHTVTPTTLDTVTAAIAKCHVLKAHARVYAEGVLRGGTLVIVHAPFGSALLAQQILDEHGPVESGFAETSDRLQAWDEAAPMSSALHCRVLLDDSATFSRFWNVRPLTKKQRTTSAALGLPELSRQRGSFNGTVGMPLLSNKGTILSSLLGLPVLIGSKR